MPKETPQEVEERHLCQLAQIRERLLVHLAHWQGRDPADPAIQKILKQLERDLTMNTRLIESATKTLLFLKMREAL